MRFLIILATMATIASALRGVSKSVPAYSAEMSARKPAVEPQDGCTTCGTDCCESGETCNLADNFCCPAGYTVLCGTDGCCPTGYECPPSGGTTCTKESSSTCFSKDEWVTLANGEERKISELQIEDQIVSYANGKLSLTNVVFLPHGTNGRTATFVQVSLTSGRTIKMTPDHLIMAAECSAPLADLPLMAASSLTPGLCLRTLTGLEEIAATEEVQDQGIYTLVTNDEFVVVNGLVASPFGVNHFVANKFYNIHRALYAMWPEALSNPKVQALEWTHEVANMALMATTFSS